jgi:hypothetical protein
MSLITIDTAQLTSGYGQFHTNEADPKKPNKALTAYKPITWEGIQHLVDYPQHVKKQKAQWFIPSNCASRSMKEQKANGRFFVMWADLDKQPPSLKEIASFVETISQGDFELFNTRSATEENQKARLLMPLEKGLRASEWILYQTAFNNLLEAQGIIPDRANQNPNQLCYLPNLGNFYDTYSKRAGVTYEGWLI